MAFKSIQTHVSDGTLESVQFSISFLSIDHLHFYVDDVEITTGSAEQGVLVDGVDEYGVTLTAAVPSGAVFKVQRQTPRDNVPHVFSTGSALFTALTVDANNEYLLYVVQETYEQTGQGPFPEITELVGTEYVTIETGGVRKQIAVQNLLASVASTTALILDLANTTDSLKGAALVGYMGRTVYDKLLDNFSAQDAGAIGDGVADDTDALQKGLDTVGSRTSPSTMQWAQQLTNRPQGTFILGRNKTYKITQPLRIPPGVTFDLNGSTVYQDNAGQDAVQLPYTGLGYPFYGRFFDCVKNGVIQGVGEALSSGRGLLLDTVNFGDFSNLRIHGFKYGRVSWEVQYSNFNNVGCAENKIGAYTTAHPERANLTSIDNNYVNCYCSRNTAYGVWNQCEANSTYTRIDAGRNGIVDVLIGGQLQGQLRTYAVVSGGSGYPANATIPVVITDPLGQYAQAYAETNSSGVVTGVYCVDAGLTYENPTITVPGGTVGAVVTGVPVTDSDFGDWWGASPTIRGNSSFDDVKIEHTADGTLDDTPSSGYAVMITADAYRQNRFKNLIVSRQGSGNKAYFRNMFNSCFGTSVDLSVDANRAPQDLENPAKPGDISMYRGVQWQGLYIRWPTFVRDSVYKYAVNAAGNVDFIGSVFHDSVDGATGAKTSSGFKSVTHWTGADAFRAWVHGESVARWYVTTGGDFYSARSGVLAKVLPLSTIGAGYNVGDADTTLTPGSSYQTALFTSPLTANRTVTLSTTGAFNGAKFRIVRSGLGAGTLNIDGLKTIPAATAAWADVEYCGFAGGWNLTGYGTL